MDYLERYLNFRQLRPKSLFNYEHINFKYSLTGKGKEVVLACFESSMFKTEAYYQVIEQLESKYQCLIIEDLKPVYQHDIMIDAVAHLIKHLNISSLHVIGMNHGGSLILSFSKKYKHAISSLVLYHSIVHTHFMNEEALELKKFFLKSIEELELLRKTISLNQIKQSLLDQIKQSLVDIEGIDYDFALEYFQYLISLFDETDEAYQMQRIKDFLLQEPFRKESFIGLSEKTYILYGDDQDVFYGPEMLELAIDLLDNPKVEYLSLNRIEMILKPHKFAYKIIKHLQKNTKESIILN